MHSPTHPQPLHRINPLLPCSPPPRAPQMAGKLVEEARNRGVIVITAGKGDIVRLVPPLVVGEEEIGAACTVLGEVAREVLA